LRAAQLAFQWLASLAIAAFLLASAAHAQTAAGEVEFARGVGFAQSPGEAPRTLGRGLQLKEGDRLTTAEGASAILRLADGTRMTLRPNSELVLQQYQFRENAPDNGFLMQMVRGGFRAVTGLISKGSPDAARVQTNAATIGIRGTDFDARLCARDCAAESAAIPDAARPNAVQASAKLTNARGEVFAVDGAGQRRRLVDGGSVYPGDVVETARGAQGVLVFRDESRVTLGSQTRFRVDNFVYDEQNAGDGRFLASLLRGSVRALTGLIGKANHRNVGFSTSTATIGVRGTGLDIVCTGACAGELASFGDGDGLTVWTWLGAVDVTPQGQTALQVLQAGQGLFIPRSGVIQPVTTQPAIEGDRPDQVAVPPKLFATAGVSDAEEGLFVFVRDGHIEIDSPREVLHLGRGEAGFAGLNGETARPALIPKFIEFDKVPLPTAHNPMAASVLTEAGVRSSNVCR
jgi:hypothetical protein